VGLDTRYSKILSLVLRHKPEEVGITLDPAGWVEVAILLPALQKKMGPVYTPEFLDRIVNENNKKRFEYNEDKTRIRASQGHSVEVELGYTATEPPEFLFHGTVDYVLNSIQAKGLLKGERHHVHLSADQETATKVGARRGKPVVLCVHAGAMHRAGAQFFVSTNGVWLTEYVPPDRIVFP
jgi:putative RNA 2'-phosphotransferase